MEVPDQLVALVLEVLVAHLAVALAGRPAEQEIRAAAEGDQVDVVAAAGGVAQLIAGHGTQVRSEEHTSELQSLMRISYAVFCLKKKTIKTPPITSLPLLYLHHHITNS